jgi:hypothetical protein
MQKLKLLLPLAFLTLILLVSPGNATRYVSLGGQFQMTYPDDWRQLDYDYVDSVLFGGQMGRYEAVFAPKSADNFTAAGWLVLTTDLTGQFNPKMIDSALVLWSKSIGGEVKKYGAADQFTTLWRPVEVSYWPKGGIASMYSDPQVTRNEHVRNQLVIRFIPKGTANFYFYAPDSLWSDLQPTILSIINSISTENIAEALSHDQVKLVDSASFSQREGGKPLDGKPNTKFSFVIYGSSAIVVIIIALAARRARQRRSEKSSKS